MKLERTWVNYYLQSTSGIVGAVLVLIMITLSLISAFGLAPHDPLEQNPMDALQGPNGTYWFGTDQFGRDIFSRSIDGMRRSLSVALLSVGLATLFGVTLGVVGGYLGRWIDNIVVRASDVIFAFPAILLALAIVNSLGNSWIDTSIAIAIVYTPIFIRVARGPVLSVKEMDYIKSARVLGYSSPRILGRHILPNVFAPVVINFTDASTDADGRIVSWLWEFETGRSVFYNAGRRCIYSVADFKTLCSNNCFESSGIKRLCEA